MKPSEHGELLRVFVSETAKFEGKPLYHAIIEKAHEAQLAGATVFKSPMGFGMHGLIHSTMQWETTGELPVVIEIIDTENRIDAFLPVLDAMMSNGLVTREAVEVIKYGAATDKA
jgi:PII-like signaling protein